VKPGYFVVVGVLILLYGQFYYPLEKYRKLDRVLNEVSQETYDVKNNNCVDMSRKAQHELEKVGIPANVVITQKKDEKVLHAYVSVWFETRTGQFGNNAYSYLTDERDMVYENSKYIVK
jgi:Zn/Cd-binding protein ZinT